MIAVFREAFFLSLRTYRLKALNYHPMIAVGGVFAVLQMSAPIRFFC